MTGLERLVFGQVRFGDDEELESFKFRFLAIVMLSGALLTGLILLGVHTGVNPITGQHVVSMSAFTTLAALLWFLLRGQRQRFVAIAWSYEVLCMLEYTSALMYVPQDELRVLWFLVNVPGVYILLGQRAGAAVAAVTVIGLAMGNAHLSAPYSPNAMATLLLSILYLAVIFHFYADRSISFFFRMRSSYQVMQHLATHDPLTGVLNARAYYAGCDQMIRLARRNQAPYAVLFVDLDHFKRINDTHGHDAGDVVLKRVAEALRRHIRDSDLVGRIGGEEFSILLPNTDLAGATQLAETLRQKIEALLPTVNGLDLPITASIGVACHAEGALSIREIQQRADKAMYEAKARGRNRVSCFEALSAATG